jgi:undecaprenyl-diphosphatase
LNGPTVDGVSGAAGKYVTACVVGHADVEEIFSHLEFIAPALFAAGLLILWAGMKERNAERPSTTAYDRAASRSGDNVTFAQAGWMGAVQGLCLPFRGFSRSGATISTGLLVRASRERAERFSFALAVILTPPAVLREVNRLLRATQCDGSTADLHSSTLAALLGMVLSFFAGLAALRWLSSWLESGRWYLFGIYCLVASCVVFYLHHIGY